MNFPDDLIKTPDELLRKRKREYELFVQMTIESINDELKAIGQYLGQVHDLAFVADRLTSFGSAKRGDRLHQALIDSREKDLEATSTALGERFYAEKPRQFARRIARYFSTWEVTKDQILARPTESANS